MLLNTCSYKAKAKLNLFLHVLGKTNDGFHELQSLVYFPNIYDVLHFSVIEGNKNNLEVEGEFSFFLNNSTDNIIIKVINFFQEHFSLKEKLNVKLIKHLPIGGGIGGGSSNAAITIIAINELFNLKVPFEDLLKIATNFGSDVAVCLYQNINNFKKNNIKVKNSVTGAIFEGKGEITTPINLPKIPILLVNPKQPLLTKEVFLEYDKKSTINKQKINNLTNQNFKDVFSLVNFLKSTENNLTESSVFLNKNIFNMLNSLQNTKAILSRMSGSGSTCFAIYSNNELLEKAKEEIKILYPNVWVAISKVDADDIL